MGAEDILLACEHLWDSCIGIHPNLSSALQRKTMPSNMTASPSSVYEGNGHPPTLVGYSAPAADLAAASQSTAAASDEAPEHGQYDDDTFFQFDFGDTHDPQSAPPTQYQPQAPPLGGSALPLREPPVNGVQHRIPPTNDDVPLGEESFQHGGHDFHLPEGSVQPDLGPSLDGKGHAWQAKISGLTIPFVEHNHHFPDMPIQST